MFLEFEAPDYCAEGVRSFKTFIDEPATSGTLTLYGAFIRSEIVGMAATRGSGSHISLFFVNPGFHRRGIGRALFEAMLRHSPAGRLTVNSSPYAAEIYRRLGFTDTAPEQLQNGIRYIPMEYIGNQTR